MGLSRSQFTKEFKLADVRRLEQGCELWEKSRSWRSWRLWRSISNANRARGCKVFVFLATVYNSPEAIDPGLYGGELPREPLKIPYFLAPDSLRIVFHLTLANLNGVRLKLYPLLSIVFAIDSI
jgi:hypothetical protein